MSISASLSNALSGLSMNSRAAELVSNNLANAMTEGYGRRILEISARTAGGVGGVQVDGIVRVGDPRLLYDRRATDAESGAAQARADALSRLMAQIGTPDDPSSLSSLVTTFENRLTNAAAEPGGPQRLEQSVTAARDLIDKLRSVGDAVQGARMQAEQDITGAVRTLNENLSEIHDLNVAISRARAVQRDSSSLEDKRQVLVDEVARLIPVRQFERPNGVIALMSERGEMILDGPPRTFGFTATNQITADLTFDAGFLSGLTLGGDPISIAPDSKLAGGELIALFDVRDRLMVDTQSNLDGLARNLVERFQDPAVDPTIPLGGAGLFTDGGSAFSAVDEVGLAARIALNALVDPAQGGEVSRMRDGLYAAAPGPVGNATILTAMRDALTASVPAASGVSAGQSAGVARFASDFSSSVAGASETADRRLGFAVARNTEFRSIEAGRGVDTDAELQKLLVIERLYAANARVIETIDAMLDSVMRI